MIELLQDWLPSALSPQVALILISCSFIASLITASFGIGGGLFLLTVLSVFLPAQTIIPVHGFIQCGSNLGRMVMARKHIHWFTIKYFLPGLLVGVFIGSLVLVQLPAAVFQLIIALFVLYLCWGPALPRKALGKQGIMALGAGTTFLTLFVGATGPLVSAFLKQLYDARFTTTATIATALSMQHLSKITVFGVMGFDYLEWLPFIGIMVLSGVIGTKVGLKQLSRFSDKDFGKIFNIFLTVLASYLLYKSLTTLFL